MSKKQNPKPTKITPVLRPKGGKSVTPRDVPKVRRDMQPGKDYETR